MLTSLGTALVRFQGKYMLLKTDGITGTKKEQEWRYTHGVKATMPMYNAEIEMEKEVRKLAKEIFARRV
jgi:hypothetical protein